MRSVATITGMPWPELLPAAAAAVGLAVLATYVAGTFHPPAGINPLLVVSNNLHGRFCSRRC
jgi:CBS-domain-containing membrane protein